jgi:DNA-binding NarL/FixJ family response regulator
MGAIRVAVVADCRLFHDGLCQILRGDPSLLLVTDAGGVTNDVNIDVRIVDAHVPSAVTFDPLKCDCVPTIVVNAPDADAWAADALNAGIRGLLSRAATRKTNEPRTRAYNQ